MENKTDILAPEALKSKIERLVIFGFVVGGILVGLMLTLIALNAFTQQQIKLFTYIALMILPVLAIVLVVIRSRVVRIKRMLYK